MRISNGMMTSSMLSNLNRNLYDMSKLQWQNATGKKIQYASDDPIVASRAMKLRTDVNEIELYKSNASDARSWIQVTEDALVTINDVLQRARELVVGASTSTQTPEDKQKTAQEIKELREELISVGNSTYAGKYIFSGCNTDQKLFNEDGTFNINYDHDRVENEVPRKFSIGVGVKIDISLTGEQVFGVVGKDVNKVMSDTKEGSSITLDYAMTADDYTNGVADDLTIRVTVNGETKDISVGTVTDDASLEADLKTKINDAFRKPPGMADTVDVDVTGGVIKIDDLDGDVMTIEQVNKYEDKSELLTVFDGLVDAMNAGDNEALTKKLGEFDVEMERMLINRSEIGAKDKRLELTLKRIESDKVTFTGLMSENEDADMAETFMKFKNAENIYRASLSVGSRVIQPSLVDFIK